MLIKAILVGLVLGLCKSEWIYGFPQVGRPIVVSTLTGLFLGDPVQGVIMGSVLELMFIGSFPIGAAVSPDYTSAGAICTAFAILTGGGKAVATAMALPIALLGGFIFIGCKLMNAASANLLPAVGFALLLQMVITKKMSPYFFIGFILAAYLSMPTIAVTLLGIMFVLVMVTSQNNQLAAVENEGGDENEF